MKTDLRPIKLTNIQHQSIAKQLAMDLRQYANWCNEPLETLQEDILDVITNSFHDNGYELAKEMEDKGYRPDSIMVEVLDGYESLYSEARKELVIEWVKHNSLVLDRHVDDEVLVNLWKQNNVIGKIVKLYPETYQYGVRAPDQDKTSHYIFDAEKVKSVTLSKQEN